ncbi:uncharacterized protein LOC130934000 [Arachis stenosperma]|uniref:uncharacterized protein LOC130934000 n=1 Tax=Arachis stenosperma TaxID=217475 RepID=UPI0025ACC2CB|nr:uncharacterized protein LOC130934000 [Arachis stenosperma]
MGDVLHLPQDVPDHPQHSREVRENPRRPTRREKGARERGGVPRDRVKPHRECLDLESEKKSKYHQQEDHGDIPDDQDDSLPPPPPPPLSPPLPPHPPSRAYGTHVRPGALYVTPPLVDYGLLMMASQPIHALPVPPPYQP